MNQDKLNQLLKDNPDLSVEGGFPFQQASGSTGPASKYRAQRTEHNGITYHSKKEAAKAAELDLMVAAGEIGFYLRQVPFDLGGAPRITYRADFVTFKQAGRDEVGAIPLRQVWTIEVIEVKGMWTGEAKMKLKLFKEKYPALKLVVE